MAKPNLGNLVVHAGGHVAEDGTLSDSVNIAEVTRNGAGDYTIELESEVDAADYIVVVTCETAADARIPSIVNQADGSFDVNIVDEAPAAADSDFKFVVLQYNLF